MKVTLIQMDIRWGAPTANRLTAERLMRSAERSDLYVLPEMWNTGFNADPTGIAEDCAHVPASGEKGAKGQCETLLWMQQMADELDAAVAGSIAVRLADGTFRNRLFFVGPQETAICRWYDKHHLFSYGHEDAGYTAGRERVTVPWRGVRFRLSTCYDLRFPFWLRNHDDYDALLCVACWPSVRRHAWDVLLQARAIENQCYVLGVNRVGSDPVCLYNGGTAFVSPYGQPVGCADDREAALTQHIDMAHLNSFRQKFPVLKDAD